MSKIKKNVHIKAEKSSILNDKMVTWEKRIQEELHDVQKHN